MKRWLILLCLLGMTVVHAPPAAAEMHPGLGRFMQRDPLEYEESSNLSHYLRGNPVQHLDPLGQMTEQRRRQCCDLRKPSLRWGVRGDTHCCDGEVITCNYLVSPWADLQKAWLPPDETVDPVTPSKTHLDAFNSWSQCVDDHERHHTTQVKCSKCIPISPLGTSVPAVGAWDPVPKDSTMTPDQMECAAYQAEVTCLRGKKIYCDAACGAILDKIADDRVKFANDEYKCSPPVK